MRLGHSGRRALAAMALRASELIQKVRNHWMFAVWLYGNVSEARLFQSDMATGAAINDTQIRQPHLLNTSLKVPLQGIGLAAVPDETEISVLIVPPLAEEVLRRSNRH